MLKKVLLTLLCVLPLSIFAQDFKAGHVNFEEIISQMPELEKVKAQVDTISKQWEDLMMKMRDEYSVKIKELQDKQSTMTDGMQQSKVAEIQEIETRITNTRQQAVTEIQNKQKELMQPIIEKVRNAIKVVATENKLTYVFDLGAQSIVYTAPTALDITPLVKKKLGLK
jgi:outer membrane protein